MGLCYIFYLDLKRIMSRCNTLVLLLIAFTFVSNGQDAEVVKSDTAQKPIDTVVINSKNQFRILSKRVGRVDAYPIDVYINGMFYRTYLVAEHQDVKLPDSVKTGDKIVLKGKKRIQGFHFRDKRVVKVKKVKFRYGTTDAVLVCITEKRYMAFLPRKKLKGGTPRFRGMHQ